MRGEVRALGLIAASGQTGRELTLMQQQRALDKTKDSAETRAGKVDMQNKVMDAVTTGKGWDAIPPELRRQADTLWFKSWLLFDPAVVVRKTNQPILIVQGSLDKQVPPDQADKLETLAKARGIQESNATKKVVVPGINHLLVPAVTGEIEEYSSLPVKVVSEELTSALITWLKEVLPTKK